jgi:hypothetical protein
MARPKKVITFQPNTISLTASDVIRLPLIPRLVRTPDYVPTKVEPRPVQPTKKALIQAKIPVKVNGTEYPSICRMMAGEGIQDKGTNNWANIRNQLKKNGKCEWKFGSGRSFTITQ